MVCKRSPSWFNRLMVPAIACLYPPSTASRHVQSIPTLRAFTVCLSRSTGIAYCHRSHLVVIDRPTASLTLCTYVAETDLPLLSNRSAVTWPTPRCAYFDDKVFANFGVAPSISCAFSSRGQ